MFCCFLITNDSAIVLVARQDRALPISAASNFEAIAACGRDLRKFLHSWWSKLHFWEEKEPIILNPQIALATIYYHATSIYLSGIFDHRQQLHGYGGPHLPQHVIDLHVNSILAGTGHALENTKLAGTLFFYPLRVAGSRATTLQQRSSIMEMLQVIKDRSFMVAEAFTSDLHNLWERQGAIGTSQPTLE